MELQTNAQEIWLPTRAAAELMGIDKRNVRINISKGKYKAREAIGNGGKQYQVLLSSLPAEAQTKYYKKIIEGNKNVSGAADSSRTLMVGGNNSAIQAKGYGDSTYRAESYDNKGGGRIKNAAPIPLNFNKCTSSVHQGGDGKCEWERESRNRGGGSDYERTSKAGAGGMVLGTGTDGMSEVVMDPEAAELMVGMDAELMDREIELEIYAQMPEWQRRYVHKYLPIMKATKGLKGKELMKFLEGARAGAGVGALELKGLSYGNFMKLKKEFEDNGISGLVPGYGKRAGESKIDDACFENFKDLYLKEGRPTLDSCWYGAKGFYIKNNLGEIPENFPTAITFLRRLLKEVPLSAIKLARYGEAWYNKHISNYANRNYDNIKIGEVWVSDHRQLDQAAMVHLPDLTKKDVKLFLKYFSRDNRKTSSPVFPWITVWRDFKSGKWMGWNIHLEDPNSDFIFQAFYDGVKRYGVPKDIYIDNGKDYRCKDFAGGRVRRIKPDIDVAKTNSICSMLHIEIHYAQPYGAQTKPIERDFRIWKEWLDKQMPGYRGGNHVERPEKLAKEIKQNKIVDFEEIVELAEFFVLNILEKYASFGKNMMGRSREEVFNNGFKGLQRVTNDALKICCMRSSGALTIKRNGITLSQRFNLYYWSEWMDPLKGRSVYLRRDINNYEEAWVFDAKSNEYLGKGRLNSLDTEALARDPLTKQQVQDVIAVKRRERKVLRSYLPMDDIQPYEIVENFALGIAAGKSNGAGAGRGMVLGSENNAGAGYFVAGSGEGDGDDAGPGSSAGKSAGDSAGTESGAGAGARARGADVIIKTDMDDVVFKENEFKRTGTYDFKDIVPADKKKKQNLIMFESDREK